MPAGWARPGLSPGIYFRLLMVGYFEGIDSERGIAWRAIDSLSIRSFVRIALDESVPDHSTIPRTRRLMDVETHQAVFQWVLQVLAEKKLLKGTTIGVDATTLEANAALRSIVRRDTGESYEEFLMRLAKQSGIETPTREQLAKLDRKRPKKGSNDDWTHPHDPDARITKMKDGRTHLAHKAEHAVDMETGAIVAVTLHGADVGDTATIPETVAEAGERITSVVADTHRAEAVKQASTDGPREVGTDKGYHSRALVSETDRVGGAHILLGTGSGTATVARATAGTTSGVCESAAHSWRTRPPAVAPARREAGAMESTLVRPGRDAPPTSARPRKHSQAVSGALRRTQSWIVDAQTARKGHAPRTGRNTISHYLGCERFYSLLFCASDAGQ
jgi:transposase